MVISALYILAHDFLPKRALLCSGTAKPVPAYLFANINEIEGKDENLCDKNKKYIAIKNHSNTPYYFF
jgi:hypothetical protein